MRKITFFLIAVSVVLLLCSCSVVVAVYDAGREAGRAEASAAAAARGPEATETPPADDNSRTGYWKEIPDTVPEFIYGAYSKEDSYKMESVSGADYTMGYRGVARQDIEAYGKELEKAGYELGAGEFQDGESILWSYMKDYSFGPMILIYFDTASGECRISVTLEN